MERKPGTVSSDGFKKVCAALDTVLLFAVGTFP